MSESEPARTKSALGLLLGAAMAWAGGWLMLRNGEPTSISAFLPWALGGLLASQGAWLAFRQLRRLLDPEWAADLERDEVERQEARNRQGVTRPMLIVGWLSAVGALGFLIAYALDDSKEHGERTLGLTGFFVGWAITALVFAVWVTWSWRRNRHSALPLMSESLT